MITSRSQRTSRRPISKRGAQSDHDKRWGNILIIVMLLLFGGGGAGYLYLSSTRQSLDPETACPVNGPGAITAVLFDRTDPFSAREQIFLENKLAELRNSTKRFEQIVTYDLLDQ